MRRYQTPKRGQIPKPYKSWFEYDVHQKIGKKYKYEPVKLVYTIPATLHRYTPDFLHKDTYYEAKGRLTLDDRKKMALVKQQYPNLNIIFIFMDSNQKLTKRSKMNYGEWATSMGYSWIDYKDLK